MKIKETQKQTSHFKEILKPYLFFSSYPKIDGITHVPLSKKEYSKLRKEKRVYKYGTNPSFNLYRCKDEYFCIKK